MQPRPLEYAIIGGGISGLALAIAMHHHGLRVKIFEQAIHPGEIGAGITFTPNALQAMNICHQAISEAFERVCTRNVWPSKQKVWVDYYDTSRDKDEASNNKPAFTIINSLGQNATHRARFFDELMKLVPDNVLVLGKRLERYDLMKIGGEANGRYRLMFADGSSDEADAILACDGIKSRVRQLMFGPEHPCALPSFTHKYIYRALVPMRDAIGALGEEKAQNASIHLGNEGHIVTFPVNHGDAMNLVACHATTEPWPDDARLTTASCRQDVLCDFADFGPDVRRLLELTRSNLDKWAVFDLGDHPPPKLADNRVCLVGDAAHATSPHYGAGAGFGIEDAAVLASLLACVDKASDVKTALEVYDGIRRPRGEWLVQSSRRCGDVYQRMASGIGDDLVAIEAEIKHCRQVIDELDVRAMCDEAQRRLQGRLDQCAGTDDSLKL